MAGRTSHDLTRWKRCPGSARLEPRGGPLGAGLLAGADRGPQAAERLWLNHFNVFQGKGNLRWTVADYEERAIRPHALGRFRDLVLATLTHPAMLVYLDNAQSAAGRTNENYARELLELHTLGVDGGYTQGDVQELARVLTGVGLGFGPEPRLKAELRPSCAARAASSSTRPATTSGTRCSWAPGSGAKASRRWRGPSPGRRRPTSSCSSSTAVVGFRLVRVPPFRPVSYAGGAGVG